MTLGTSSASQKIAFSGEIVAGDVWSLDVGGTSVTYTAKIGDTVDEVARSLQNQVSSLSGYASEVDDQTLVISSGSSFVLSLDLQPAGSMARVDQLLSIDADAGVFALSEGTDATDPLAYDLDADALRESLESLPAVGENNVAVLPGSQPGQWQISFLNGITPTLTSQSDAIDIDNASGQTIAQHAGLVRYQLAPATASILKNVENAQGGEGDDLLIGSAGDNVFKFDKEWGHDIVIGLGGEDVLDFSALAPLRTNAVESGNKTTVGDLTYEVVSDSLVVAYVRNGSTIEHSVIAYGNFGDPELPATPGSVFAEKTEGYFQKKLFLPQVVADGPGPAVVGATLTVGDAVDSAIVTQAIAAWQAVLPAQTHLLNGLSSLNFEIVDFASDAQFAADPNKYVQLGRTGLDVNNQIVVYIDNDAAGYGWHTNSGTAPASNTMDLLTVVAHELGHVLGLTDVNTAGSVMNMTLTASSRHTPAASDATAVMTVDKNQLSHGLDTFSDWAANIGDRISDYFSNAGQLPFTDETVGGLLGLDTVADQIKNQIVAQVDALE